MTHCLTHILCKAGTLLSLFLLLQACASFDRTHIPPGQEVGALGVTFKAPTERPWFASEYGTGSRIKLMQLNDDSIYSILVTFGQGPARGMFQTAEDHLAAMQRHIRRRPKPPGYIQHSHKEVTDQRYGELCVRYHSSGEDWRGRNRKGPAIVKTIGLTCPHPELDNVLVSFEFSSRAEVGISTKDMEPAAKALFASIEYHSLD